MSTLFDDLSNAGAIPALEMTVRFAGQRQQVIAHNIANFSTPDFRPLEVSTADFQRTLGAAIDERRRRFGGEHGVLGWHETRELRRDGRGELRLVPRTPSGNILFHDRNNRDLERTMQDLAENASVFRVASDLLRSRYGQLKAAISERTGA